MPEDNDHRVAGAEPFATTHWSAVMAAADSQHPRAATALTELCQTYWYPLYVFLRRKGVAPHEAEDLTQAFFADLLARNPIARANPVAGRFRSFLVASMENFLRNQWRHRSAQKRGGGHTPIPLDDVNAEQRLAAELPVGETPADAYNREWARTLLDKTIRDLQGEWDKDGRGDLSREFQAHLWGDVTSIPYADLCSRFDMTPVNLRVTFHRYRQRYRELLRHAIAATVAQESEIEEELRFLMQVVGR